MKKHRMEYHNRSRARGQEEKELSIGEVYRLKRQFYVVMFIGLMIATVLISVILGG